MCFQEEPGHKQTKFSSAKNSTRYIFGIVAQCFLNTFTKEFIEN